MSVPNLPTGSGFATVPRSKRLKIDIACDPCRTKKIKCDGLRPICGKCARRFGKSDQCHYSADSVNKGGRPSLAVREAGQTSQVTHKSGTGRPASHILPTPSPPYPVQLRPQKSPSLAPRHHVPTPILPKAPDASRSSLSHGSSTHERPSVDSMNAIVDGTSTEYFGSSSAGSFSSQIKAAIEERLGRSQVNGARPSQLRPLHSVTTKRSTFDISNLLLPPRRLANELMQTYWQFIAPLYPFLDRRSWEECYENVFAGRPIEADESIFIATMNMIFALSTQLKEHLDQDKREHTSNVYFERAREPLDTMMWTSGSLELVQYLLLAGQYLQCTVSTHQTWMVVGSAARIAESLGLHLPETSATAPTTRQQELYRRIWHGCILMDRMVSLTHGRPSMIAPELVPCVPYPRFASQIHISENMDGMIDASFFVKSAELYEITHELTVRLYPTSARRSKQPPGATLEDLTTIIQLDDKITEWEGTIPDHLVVSDSGTSIQTPPCREAVILRLRHLHARILLLRPVLALLCLPKAQQQPHFPDFGLREKLYQQCAQVCVSTAQGTISLLSQYQSTDGTVGLLPAWWYRLYYLFSASTVLIAAKLRPDIFTTGEVDDSWDQAMQVFRALKNVSLSAQKCVAALHILSSKILQTNQGEPYQTVKTAEVLDASLGGQTLPHDFGWDANQSLDFSKAAVDDFTFEVDDMSWLNYMTTWNVLGD